MPNIYRDTFCIYLIIIRSDSKDNTSILRKISKEIAFEFKGQTNDKSENDSFVN